MQLLTYVTVNSPCRRLRRIEISLQTTERLGPTIRYRDPSATGCSHSSRQGSGNPRSGNINGSTHRLRGATGAQTLWHTNERAVYRGQAQPFVPFFLPIEHLLTPTAADAYIDPITGQKMAQGQISWFIRKGEQLSDDRKISRAFKRTFRKYSGPWLDAMVACDLDVPPTRITPGMYPLPTLVPLTQSDVKNLCIITADLSNIRKACYERRWKNWKRYYIARLVVSPSL